MIGLLRNPYAILGIAAALVLSHGFVAVKVGEIATKNEAARWLADKVEQQQKLAEAEQARQQAIAEREQQRQQSLQEAANEIAQIRVEHLPGKIIVQKRIVEKPVYRDCVVEPDVLRIVNAALSGHPVTGEAPERVVDGGVPRNPSPTERF